MDDVERGVATGTARGGIVHVDASLIRADVAWESLAVRYVEALTDANGDSAADPEGARRLRDPERTGKFEKVCLTDPDASMATSGRNRGLEQSEPSSTASGMTSSGWSSTSRSPRAR